MLKYADCYNAYACCAALIGEHIPNLTAFQQNSNSTVIMCDAIKIFIFAVFAYLMLINRKIVRTITHAINSKNRIILYFIRSMMERNKPLPRINRGELKAIRHS